MDISTLVASFGDLYVSQSIYCSRDELAHTRSIERIRDGPSAMLRMRKKDYPSYLQHLYENGSLNWITSWDELKVVMNAYEEAQAGTFSDCVSFPTNNPHSTIYYISKELEESVPCTTAVPTHFVRLGHKVVPSFIVTDKSMMTQTKNVCIKITKTQLDYTLFDVHVDYVIPSDSFLFSPVFEVDESNLDRCLHSPVQVVVFEA